MWHRDILDGQHVELESRQIWSSPKSEESMKTAPVFKLRKNPALNFQNTKKVSKIQLSMLTIVDEN
jgi:hypothetical protein